MAAAGGMKALVTIPRIPSQLTASCSLTRTLPGQMLALQLAGILSSKVAQYGDS